MKWTQLLLIIVLLLGFPLLQTDQVIGIEWLVCERSLAIKSEQGSPCTIKSLWRGFESISSLFNRISRVFQLKNPLYVLFSSFQRTTLFQRPPPATLTLMSS